MACTSPLPAWRTPAGSVVLREPYPRPDGTIRLHVPCSRCIGCRMAQARAWAVRCKLELQVHDAACWVTLTYDEAHVPPTLHKGHLQKWLKRVRAHYDDRRVRFFACGEYGERFGRPHYHSIIFGVGRRESAGLVAKWAMGGVQVDELSPAAIAYVCGYQLKKAGERDRLEMGGRVPYDYDGPSSGPYVDRKTGEMYRNAIVHEPPFLQMSRNPGIGGHARDFWRSWRSSSIWSGKEVPVPRYLHQAWKNKASVEELLQLEEEKLSRQPSTLAELDEKYRHNVAQAVINQARKRETLLRRKL